MNIFDIFNPSDNHREESRGSGTSGLTKIAMLGLPILFMALKKKNQDEAKAKELTETLSRHDVQPSGSMFDHIERADAVDGGKILGHILGDNRSDVIGKIAAQTGVSAEEVQKVLAKIAPSVLEQIASDTRDDRSVESVRQSTDRQLERYQADENTFDLKDIAGKILGGGGIGDALGGLLGGLLK